MSLSSFCAVYIVLLRQCYVAMPSGYKLVITRALGMHGIYCSRRFAVMQPSCFSAIYSIHPLCPCYNYNLYTLTVIALITVIPSVAVIYIHYGDTSVGMCTGVTVHDLSCSILFYPDVLFIMCHTIHLRCCVIHSFSFGCLFTH